MNFSTMFAAIHGYEPFPWQCEAARRLIEGEPFASVTVPTACGKTALIDAAVFAAAHGGPRHIVYIIDRRVVVDEAYDRAQRIAHALTQPFLQELAEKLGPIQVVRLRGGVHGDDDWVLYPDRVAVMVSTVDQIGSRLLHRGYGVSTRMAPLHAGFVGNDALYITDEAHLSAPFIQTVQSTIRYGADIRIIAMTATPMENESATVGLTSADESHLVLQQRLLASKKARLMMVEGVERDFVAAAVSAAEQLSQSVRVVGIIVNRVATARNIRQALVKRKHRAELLTGRVRPHDRDRLMERLLPEIRAGRTRTEGPALFVVATQTVEVGADIDFDALLTEAAALDALRQRFGRLDRLGEMVRTQAIILYRQPKLDSNGRPIPDPIYGETIHGTWQWLNKVSYNGCVDFGIAAIAKTFYEQSPPARNIQHGPTLLPAHISLLAQTGPDAPELDVSPWLHGAGSGAPDVSIVWRMDLDNSVRWEAAVRLRPPLTLEALEIPLYAAQSWLEGGRSQDVADLEGVRIRESATEVSGKPVLCWRGPEDCRLISPRDVRPGDTLVVPSVYGGCDAYGWAPNSKTPVEDIADVCSLERKGPHVVRLVRGLTGWLGAHEERIHEGVAELLSAETDTDPETGIDEERIQIARSSLRALLSDVDHPLIMAFRGEFEIERHPAGVVLRGRIMDDVGAALSGGVAVELDRHLKGVATLADRLAAAHPEQRRIVLAAKQHDLGKAEPRFQVMLHGNPLIAASGPTLAKSGLRKLSQLRAAYARSDLPAGFRHELASLAYASEPDLLVRYLIGAHHGYGRPWFPPCADAQAPGTEHISLGNRWAEAFAALLQEWGPWKLTGMELLLRASDIRRSMEEQEKNHV